MAGTVQRPRRIPHPATEEPSAAYLPTKQRANYSPHFQAPCRPRTLSKLRSGKLCTTGNQPVTHRRSSRESAWQPRRQPRQQPHVQ
eukprot:2899940-Pleurochrysis_carterae.AAC.1